MRAVIIRIYKDNDCQATSGVNLGKLVLCPALPILSTLPGSGSKLHSILRCLLHDHPFGVYHEVLREFNDSKCVVVPPQSDHELPALPKLIFTSQAIRSTFETLLSPGQSLKLNARDSFTPKERSVLLSSFIAFELQGKGNLPLTNKTSETRIQKPDGLFSVIATPYGNAVMKGSTFKCEIANVINSSLYLLDIPLAKGCEGGLLMSPHLDPMAMVLTTTFESQNENLNLTFAADLNVILNALNRFDSKDSPKAISWPNEAAAKHVVLIESDPNAYGTGTLISIGKGRLILTCSHVISGRDQNYCTWQGRRFPIKLIYKNPVFDRPFDVAVFHAPKNIPNSAFCKPRRRNPILGSPVKSIGFPIFDPQAVRELNIQPSIYRGRVVNYRAGMVITDTVVQSGQSGGPLFDEQDRMVGISVSNFRDNDTGRVFPALNCSVPLFNIVPILTAYCESNDVNCLKQLEGSPYLQRLWNFDEPIVQLKL